MGSELIPEPPDGQALYWRATDTGEFPVVMVRDDRLARDWGDHRACWFEANTSGEPMTWEEMREHSTREGYPLAEATVLVPPDDVAKAVKGASLVVVGEHIIEAAGYCRTCGVPHSTVEIARLEDLLTEGNEPGA